MSNPLGALKPKMYEIVQQAFFAELDITFVAEDILRDVCTKAYEYADQAGGPVNQDTLRQAIRIIWTREKRGEEYIYFGEFKDLLADQKALRTRHPQPAPHPDRNKRPWIRTQT